MEIKIRTAKVEDAEKLLDIYSYYVKKTAVTFEYEVPSVEEFQERIRHISSHYPYLIVEEEGEIIGYSYADRLRPRAAFGWDVEMTIYLKQDIRRNGLGRHMYTLMEDILREQGVVNAVSLITKPTDEYSDFNSVQFHEKMGYKHAGELKDCGYMDKQIGIPQEEMPPIRDFDEVREKFGL